MLIATITPTNALINGFSLVGLRFVPNPLTITYILVLILKKKSLVCGSKDKKPLSFSGTKTAFRTDVMGIVFQTQ